MTSIAKVVVFWRADGFSHTAGYFWRCLGSWCGLRASETLFFRREGVIVPRGGRCTDACEFVEMRDALALEKYDYPRLRYVPYHKWFARGSVCFVGLIERSVVSYCWIHEGSYWLGRVGRFALRDNEVWIGPVFVDKRYRGRAINIAQIDHAIQEQSKAGKTVFFTATNSRNYPSIKSFVRCGFAAVGVSRTRSLFGRCVSSVICDLDNRQFVRESVV